ncbi:MAG: undecaprenyl-diphosphate phosphatase [Clostridia bacterium]|nr:undecaprenyl-diphosphate phosphatase [Clostridia bacterium]
MIIFEILKSVILGIVEGITEWLPISSTGHIILVDEFLRLNMSDGAKGMFEVVIQLGAVAAVPIYFFDKLNPFSRTKNEAEKKNTWKLWSKVIVGALPAAIAGVLLDDFLDGCFYNYFVVALMLILYGVIFIVVERIKRNKAYKIESVDDISYGDALKIGGYQVLSLIPGTSRSGSTILGGMLSGVCRSASAEFSFFMAIPIMLGASGLKILKFILEGLSLTGDEIIVLLIGIAVSFFVSLFSIKFLMDFVKRHDFAPFGVYRIILGIAVILYFLIRNCL